MEEEPIDFCPGCPQVVDTSVCPLTGRKRPERIQVKCSHCGHETAGIELTPGAVSAICEKCNSAREIPLAKPQPSHSPHPGTAGQKRKRK